MGVIVGVAVIVTMVSFGLGLQRNMLDRFKALDLFNEMQVFGRTLGNLAQARFDQRSRPEDDERARRLRADRAPTRILDDAAIAEIASIPGVAYVEPSISFTVYVRTNGQVLTQFAGGTNIPNSASRFQHFAAGKMIGSPTADEVVVTERFVRDFGFENPQDAIGKVVEFLEPPSDKKSEEDQAPTNFFGIPLEEEAPNEDNAASLVGHTFQIAGVLSAEVKEGVGQGGVRGMMPGARIYVPLKIAREWTLEHRSTISEVALELARQSGALSGDQHEGYDAAVIRVTNPAQLSTVRQRLKELGFGSFSIVDELDQIRTVFLIVDSALGLLGGISLLVASFGIANTMIMSILERTREIGIMKAIGAEDREIKLIFFVEAAVIGLTGGIVGTLVAWGVDGIANRLAYRFLLKPQGASFIDFFSLPPYLSAGAILFALIISILAALYPAARAARIDPVRALRHD